MTDAFKKMTAAIDGDPVLNEICKLAFQAGAEDAREQMKAEVEALRDPRAVVQRALLIAAMLPENETKTAGSMRLAAVELFGEANVVDALKEWRGAARPGGSDAQ